MRTAIVFYSMSGNVKQTAEKIAQAVSADLIELTPKKRYPDKGFRKFFWGGKSAAMCETPRLEDYSFDPDKYDSVVIGFPVWAGTLAPPIRTFVNDNRAALAGKRISAFACMSGNGAERAFEKLRSYMAVDSIYAKLILIDPKTKPSVENDGKIAEFCEKIR